MCESSRQPFDRAQGDRLSSDNDFMTVRAEPSRRAHGDFQTIWQFEWA
jgi:hypothetical protein